MKGALAAVPGWPGTTAAGYIQHGAGEPVVTGPTERVFAWASVTKVVTAMCIWTAVEEGSVGWDDPAGPEGAVLADLLSHASGLAPDSDRVLARPRSRRIYSNRGIEVAAEHLAARTGIAIDEYMSEAVLQPLGMNATRLDGSPAHGISGPLDDLLKLGRELLDPKLVSAEMLTLATTVATPGLAGILPGFGKQDPNDWGLGVEIRSHKTPHWTGRRNSPAAFGHFGQAGGFIWVDPALGLGTAALGSEPFGPWAAEAWPDLSDAVIQAAVQA